MNEVAARATTRRTAPFLGYHHGDLVLRSLIRYRATTMMLTTRASAVNVNSPIDFDRPAPNLEA